MEVSSIQGCPHRRVFHCYTYYTHTSIKSNGVVARMHECEAHSVGGNTSGVQLKAPQNLLTSTYTCQPSIRGIPGVPTPIVSPSDISYAPRSLNFTASCKHNTTRSKVYTVQSVSLLAIHLWIDVKSERGMFTYISHCFWRHFSFVGTPQNTRHIPEYSIILYSTQHDENKGR